MNKKKLVGKLLIFLILGFSLNSYSQIHLGVPSAVKHKVKQLKQKVQSTPSVQYKLGPNTIILTSQTDSYLVSQDTNTNIYYYSTQATQISSLKPNAIIISTKGEGFLRKVESINLIGNQYEVKTTRAFP